MIRRSQNGQHTTSASTPAKMPSSAFKSTTQRTPISPAAAAAAAGNSSARPLRRSRSHSRFPRPISPSSEDDYNRIVPRGKFVNTARGSSTPFSEISLDDLALEFFSSSSSSSTFKNDNVPERERRESRRWASDTASSSRRGRSVSVSRRDAAACSTVKGKNATSSDAVSRRRRSLSVVRNQVQTDVHSHKSRSRATSNASFGDNGGIRPSVNRFSVNELHKGRSRSRTDIYPFPCYDYSSQSSALTDDESKDIQVGKTAFGKAYEAAYSLEKDFESGLYEAMRKELRCAVEEIRSEFNQLRTHGDCIQMENSVSHRELPIVPEKCAPKLRKRSCDRGSVSEALIEEAEKYFVDFICNIDADRSSIDEEKTDEGSSFGVGGVVQVPDAPNTDYAGSIYGGLTKATDVSPREHGSFITPRIHTAEMDGVVLPWLQWETVENSYSSSSAKNEPSSVSCTPQKCEPNKEGELDGDSASSSCSHGGSWIPCQGKRINVEEYLSLRDDDQLVFEMYREKNRIHTGGLLMCRPTLY